MLNFRYTINMKGIVLAGGKGTRLFPITIAVSKHLLPVYDKPMIYYPLSILMLSNIKEILIISKKEHISFYKTLLGDGSRLGIKFEYAVQDEPRGIAEAFLIGEDFIGNDFVSLILGDNILYGQGLTEILNRVVSTLKDGAVIFGYYVKNPSEFGVVEFDYKTKKVISLEEKPPFPKSNYAIPGLYFYDNTVVEKAHSLTPSKRNELEITDLNRLYLNEGKLKVELFGRGLAWFDTGTPDGLLNASNFVEAIQKRQGLYIACLEEIAYLRGYIDQDQLKQLIKERYNSVYGNYLKRLIDYNYID